VYIWYLNDFLARIIIYICLSIDILHIETVLYYYDLLVYVYNMHPDQQASTFGTNCAYYKRIFMVVYYYYYYTTTPTTEISQCKCQEVHSSS